MTEALERELEARIGEALVPDDEGLPRLSDEGKARIAAELDRYLDREELPALVRVVLGFADTLESSLASPATAAALVELVERPPVLASLRRLRPSADEVEASPGMASRRLLGLPAPKAAAEPSPDGPRVGSLPFPRRV